MPCIAASEFGFTPASRSRISRAGRSAGQRRPRPSRLTKSPSGYPVQSPYVSIANRQTEIMMRIASEFGFTPASRSRISRADYGSSVTLRRSVAPT
jgi:phage terminase small subunit